MEPIVTARLKIRRFVPDDLDDYLGYQSRPEVRAFMPGQPHTDEQAARFLARQASMVSGERGQYHAYAVEHLADARVIGDVGVYLHLDRLDEGDIGFQFHPNYHHQGYASEVVTALIAYLFETIGLERVTSNCDERNSASRRLIERVGMKQVSDHAGECSYLLIRDAEDGSFP